MGSSPRAGQVVLTLLALTACDDAPEPVDTGAAAPVHAPDGDGATRHAEAGPRDASGAARDADVDSGVAPSLLVARGEYLVRHLAGCVECHSPRHTTGLFDDSRLLSGVSRVEDLDPEDPSRGALHAPNLTPHESGLGEWSDQEIKDAFQHGRARDGRVLHWTMPYWIYHEMSEADADAVVAYLRSLPAIEHAVPEREPLPVEPDAPVHLPHGTIPPPALAPDDPRAAAARRGHYLVQGVALCVYCHTPPDDDPALPLDAARLFMGRRPMVPVRLGSATDPGLPTIETRNLTPHATGLGDWSAEDVANALRWGVSPGGLPTCDPMPSTQGGSLMGLERGDALDVGSYLLALPPRDSGEIEACCAACHDPAADAGL